MYVRVHACATIDAHVQYILHGVIGHFCEKTSRDAICAVDHASEQGMPMSSYCTTEANFARARARQKVQSATALCIALRD